MDADKGSGSATPVAVTAAVATSDVQVQPAAEGKSNTSKQKKAPEPTVPYGKLLQYMDGWDKALWVVGTISAVANGAVMPAFSLVFGELLDGFHPGSPNDNFMALVTKFSWIISVVGGAAFVLAYTEIAPFVFAGERQMKRIREVYVRAILMQDIKWFDERNIDELVTRVTGDTSLIAAGIGDKVGMGIRYVFTFLFGFAMGFAYSWQLTLVMLAMTPFMALAGALMMKFISEFEEQGQKAYAAAGGIAEERLGGIRTVQACAGQDQALQQYDVHLEAAKKSGIKKGITQGFSLGIMMLVMFIMYGLSFWVGSLLIANDREDAVQALAAAGCKVGTDFRSVCVDPATWEPLTNVQCWSLCPKLYECLSGIGCQSGGDIMNVFFSVITGAMAIGQIGPSGTAIASARVAGKRFFDAIATAAKDASGGGTRAPPAKIEQGIKLSNVTFAYPTRPDQQVLKGFSLDIKPGATVAFVGRSGCGKSTIIGLLEKFYKPDSGSITIDGVDLADYHTAQFRSAIGLVGQEPVLFSGTIADNIAFGSPKPVTIDDIKAAAAAANATAFIDTFPDGYNTLVGQGGKALSGGQKQRIAIARALIRKPAIMLLDEATSALDSTSEAVVQAALNRIMSDESCIKIVIAHRLSTIKTAHQIVVVNDGVVAEQGTHEELMDIPNGIYRDLVEAQASGRDARLTTESKDDAAKDGDADASHVQRHREASVAASAVSEVERKADTHVPTARIWRMSTQGSLVPITVGLLCSAIQGVTMPLFAVVFADIITLFFDPNTDKMKSDSAFYAWMFVAIGAATFLGSIGQMGCFGLVGERLTKKLRFATFKAMIFQDMAFHDQEVNNTGALTTRLATDATLVNALATERLALTSQHIVTIITGLVISFKADWRLTLVSLSIVPLLYLASKLQMINFTGATTAGQAALAKAGHIVSESIHGVRTVHAFNLQDKVIELYVARLDTPLKAGVNGGHVSGLGFGFSQFVMIASYGFVFYIGGLWVDNGTLTFNDLMRCLMAIMMSAMSMGQTNSMAMDAGKATAAAKAIFGILDATPRVPTESSAGLRPDTVDAQLEFKDVTFTYPTRKGRVLKHFSLTVPAGHTLALVGTSGSGKSTIVQLLQRFYVPDSGSISLDGRDVADVNVQWLRKNIGVVSQEPILFKGTVSENIAYGKHPDNGPATQQEIEAAARMANAHDFIMADLPKGYDTDITSATLSGGQKQRIAIARAIIRDPAILLLDEATSALDNRSEEIVQEALDALMRMKRRTTIVIAHRLSTIKHADMIVVLEKGEIIQQGTHEYLKSVPGKYKEMWDQQLLVAAGQRIV